MITTRIMNMQNEDELEAVLAAYYELFDPELQCIEQRTTPEEYHLTSVGVIVVGAYEDDVLSGVMIVDQNCALYPVFTNERVFEALVWAAHNANNDYLFGWTENQNIINLVVGMNLKNFEMNGNEMHFGVGANSPVSEWGSGR